MEFGNLPPELYSSDFDAIPNEITEIILSFTGDFLPVASRVCRLFREIYLYLTRGKLNSPNHCNCNVCISSYFKKLRRINSFRTKITTLVTPQLLSWGIEEGLFERCNDSKEIVLYNYIKKCIRKGLGRIFDVLDTLFEKLHVYPSRGYEKELDGNVLKLHQTWIERVSTSVSIPENFFPRILKTLIKQAKTERLHEEYQKFEYLFLRLTDSYKGKDLCKHCGLHQREDLYEGRCSLWEVVYMTDDDKIIDIFWKITGKSIPFESLILKEIALNANRYEDEPGDLLLQNLIDGDEFHSLLIQDESLLSPFFFDCLRMSRKYERVEMLDLLLDYVTIGNISMYIDDFASDKNSKFIEIEILKEKIPLREKNKRQMFQVIIDNANVKLLKELAREWNDWRKYICGVKLIGKELSNNHVKMMKFLYRNLPDCGFLELDINANVEKESYRNVGILLKILDYLDSPRERFSISIAKDRIMLMEYIHRIVVSKGSVDEIRHSFLISGDTLKYLFHPNDKQSYTRFFKGRERDIQESAKLVKFFLKYCSKRSIYLRGKFRELLEELFPKKVESIRRLLRDDKAHVVVKKKEEKREAERWHEYVTSEEEIYELLRDVF